ncbi:MAG TPA: hypothetical protein VFH27_11520, partial [Longimicrobiaceae bacterium]|nr:hypothetical protein [Longimicrobiaceae bacterium]
PVERGAALPVVGVAASVPAARMSPHLAAALAAVSDRIPPERIDQAWLFPPRTLGEKESGLAVLTLYPLPDSTSPVAPAGDGRREVWTLQYEAERVKGGKTNRTDTLLEQATVPAGLLTRIVDGVVRRMGEGAHAPDVRDVEGRMDVWTELLAELGVSSVDLGS